MYFSNISHILGKKVNMMDSVFLFLLRHPLGKNYQINIFIKKWMLLLYKQNMTK